jgi:hypothetical protein
LQKQHKLYIAIAFVVQYKHPPQTEWDNCAAELAEETEMDVRSIKSIFHSMNEHKNIEVAVQEREKSGRPPKLTKDNAGLVAAAAALNSGVSPQQAVYVCNAVNKKEFDKSEKNEGQDYSQYVTFNSKVLHKSDP